MKRAAYFLALAFCMTVMGGVAQGQLLLQEHFVYSTGSLPTVSSGAWILFSGTTSPQVTAGSLSYPSYLGSAGNKVDIVETGGEDDYRDFAIQGVGTTTYAAFLLNVLNTSDLSANSSTTGDYFAGFLPSTSVTFLVARVSIRTGSVAGTFQLGLRATSTNATTSFSAANLTPGTTYLVVISYQVVSGDTNDPVNMWINPAVGGSQPAADLNQTTATVTDNADTARFFFRQGANSGNVSFDTLRVGQTWESVTSSPSAADGLVSGTITDDQGTPVAGTVVNLSGAQNRKTITNAKGYYQFDEVETSGFYTVTPSRANYSFSPSNRSFSQLGNHTDAAFTGSSGGDNLNPLDTPEYFVRQQYVDVLGREPDEGGFNYWSNEILNCGSDTVCGNARRRDVAAAFFIEQEFQQTGAFIYDVYKSALGRKPVFAEYSSDRRQVIGGASLASQRAAFADGFVQRTEFMQKYQANTTANSFVDALIQNVQQSSQVDLSSQRDNLIAAYNSGSSMNQSRSLVVRAVADDAAFKQKEYNAAFVLTEYFNYLRRDAEPEGYDFWLNVINNGDVGNYRGMVCAFITSTEYQKRFSSVVTHSNAECGN